MTSRAILDTDTLSDILKGKNANTLIRARLYAEEHGIFTYTAVSVHEILYGLYHRDAKNQLQIAERSFEEHEVLLPLIEDFRKAGEIRGIAKRSGVQLAMDDCLIGAVAERIGLPVVTSNVRHFEAMISVGLQITIESWR